MNKLETFEQFLAGQTPSIEIADFAINMILTFFLTLLISIIYVRFGNTRATTNELLCARISGRGLVSHASSKSFLVTAAATRKTRILLFE